MMNMGKVCPHIAGALLAVVLAFPGLSLAQSGSVNSNGWTFNYAVSGLLDGLSLSGVQFNGLPLINKISLPVMRVFYDGNPCGPYADRLGGTLSPIPWAGNATVAKREFDLNGRHWYEIGIRDQIGSYDMYQVYYLSNDGVLDAHIYSKGLQCNTRHDHFPNWRIDFDINGSSNDQIQGNIITAYETRLTEFDASASDASNHGWRVRDSVTGNFVDVLPGFTDFTIPPGYGSTLPVAGYSHNRVFGRLFKATEDNGWPGSPGVPQTPVPNNNSESINNQDLLFWYEGYLPHSPAEGSALWHSTGVRLVVNGGLPPPSPTPTPPPGTTQTFSNTAAISIPGVGSGSPYPSTINVAGMAGVVSKVVVRLNGLNHTWPDDIDILLVGPGGQKVMLMSDAGYSSDVVNVNLTFDSSASSALPDSAQILSGTYRPTNFEATDPFTAPAPAGPYGSSLSAFNLTSPNGTWALYVIDDVGNDLGTIAGGWEIIITSN